MAVIKNMIVRVTGIVIKSQRLLVGILRVKGFQPKMIKHISSHFRWKIKFVLKLQERQIFGYYVLVNTLSHNVIVIGIYKH